VKANAFEEEHRSHLFGGRAALEEASVVEKYTCKSIFAIGKFRDPAWGRKKEEAEVQVRASFFIASDQILRITKYLTNSPPSIQIADNTDASNKQGGRFLRSRERNLDLGHQKKEHEPNERDGTLVSQVSTLEVDIMTDVPQVEEQLQEEGGEAPKPKAKGKGSKSKTAKLPSGPIKLNTSERRLTDHTQRRLGTLFRTNRMLVILVNDSDGRKPTFGANETSDKIFGTYGDEETPSVQLSGCSNNQTSLTPDSGDEDVNALMDAPGVVEVSITISIRPFDSSKIENDAIKAANQKLGMSLPGMFDFVAIVIEDCYDSNDCGFAAYAYLNSWKSVYVKDYHVYPAVMTHELGHNFNFGHSGRVHTYDDWSCSMGNPLWADHLDKMCFK